MGWSQKQGFGVGDPRVPNTFCFGGPTLKPPPQTTTNNLFQANPLGPGRGVSDQWQPMICYSFQTNKSNYNYNGNYYYIYVMYNGNNYYILYYYIIMYLLLFLWVIVMGVVGGEGGPKSWGEKVPNPLW